MHSACCTFLRRLTAPALFLFGTALGAAETGPAPKIPVEAFFKKAATLPPSVSPDGTTLIYATHEKEDDYLLTAVNLPKQTSANYKVSGGSTLPILWLTNTRVVIYSDTDGYGVFDLQKRRSDLFNKGEWLNVLNQRDADPNLITVLFNEDRSGGRTGFAVINVQRALADLPGESRYRYNVTNWIDLPKSITSGWVDRLGHVRVAQTYEGKKMSTLHRPTETADWTKLQIDDENDQLLGFHSDPAKFFIAHRPEGKSTLAFYAFDTRTQSYGDALLSDPTFSMSTARGIKSRKDGTLIGLTYQKDAVTTQWFSALHRQIQALMDRLMPGKINQIVDTDDNNRLFVISSYSDVQAVRYYTFDLANKELRALPESRPELKPELMNPMQVIRFQSRDGLNLQGYLTLPRLAPGAAKPALVVLPHGGPWVRDVWGFDREAQFLSNRGYAVFQPNYRGSIGFAHEVSVVPEFDFKAMHDDVTDGVKQIIASGLIDPTRIAIMGGSFGGYLAVCGAAFEPALYRCAITLAGVFDWEKIINQNNGRSRLAELRRDYLLKRLGDPAQQKAKFDSISPLRHTDKIRIPVYVSHGDFDSTVDSDQSRALVSLLKKNQTPVESFFPSLEGHGYFETKNQLRLYREIETFLSKYL